MGRLKDEVFFQTLNDYFNHYLPVQRCASIHTIKAYRSAIHKLLEYILKKKNIKLNEVGFEDLDYETVDSYLENIVKEQGLSQKTRNHRLNSILSFLSYAADMTPEYMIYHSNISKIPKQKVESKAVEYMSEKVVHTLINQADTKTKKGIRNQFIMILMYDTGARIQEIINLKACDIKLGKIPTVMLFGKGNKTRVVPIMEYTVSHYLNYLQIYHKDENEYSKKPLFYTKRKNIIQAMSDDNIRKFLNQYADSARKICPEVPEKIHPHLFRHSRAMHLYQHGMDLTSISQWLGHSNLETTLIYAHADTDQKRRAIEKSMGKNIIGEIDIPKYIIDDEDILKKLYGLI